LTVRGAYSQTVARPSFRELGYYTTIRPGSSDRFMGNPQLELSEVESFDARLEYVFGDFGDLVAASFFYKTIDKPIEVIVLRDFAVRDFPYAEGPFRVYRNNENEAELMGIELEARLTLDVPSLVDSVSFFEFLEPVSFLQYFSIGGNYTYIDAEVERSQVEIDRATDFFRATPADLASGAVRFDQLNKKRRLFNQPEWIANADVTFDQPDWGTKLTLSYFAISEVLNAAGAASIAANGRTDAYVLDEFTDSFYQLDAVASQSFEIPFVPGEWTVKASVKNLTDSIRKVVYDPEQTSENFRKDAYKVGRDYSFSLGYEIAF
jgi:outer membrane receptor protein involved in Fe transport